VRERRSARIGTVSGLALLVGGTAVAAVAGGAHSIFATLLLGLLAVGMGHALLDEIRRQARRESPGGWANHDTINAALLATWAIGALIATVLAVHPTTVRAVGLTLSLAYAVSCAHFVLERRRAIALPRPQRLDTEAISAEPATQLPLQPTLPHRRGGHTPRSSAESQEGVPLGSPEAQAQRDAGSQPEPRPQTAAKVPTEG
jgi:hypothetical protein